MGYLIAGKRWDKFRAGVSKHSGSARARISRVRGKVGSASSHAWGEYKRAMRGRGFNTGSMRFDKKTGTHVPVSKWAMRGRTAAAYGATGAALGGAAYGGYKLYKHLKNRRKNRRGRRHEEVTLLTSQERLRLQEALFELLGHEIER